MIRKDLKFVISRLNLADYFELFFVKNAKIYTFYDETNLNRKKAIKPKVKYAKFQKFSFLKIASKSQIVRTGMPKVNFILKSHFQRSKVNSKQA